MSVGEILAAIPTQSQDLRERGYKFRQTKALNDAWANSLDAVGRPDEVKFMRAAAMAGLGPDATQAYWNQQTASFKAGAEQAQAANIINSLGGDFTKIKGPMLTPTVTEQQTTASTGLADFLRPGSSQTPAAQSAGPMDLSGGSDAAPAAGGGAPASAAEGEVVIQASAPEGTRAPQVGMLPEIDLGRTYTPPPEEGVATQFARSINPTMPSLMAQAGQQQVQGTATEAPAASLSFETMNPTERKYAERFLARSGIPGNPEQQLRAFEETAMRGVAAPVPFNPMRAMVASPGGAMIMDPSKMAEEQNRAAQDMARYQSERQKAVAEARKAMFGAYEGIQAPTIARAGAESSLLEKSRPIIAANDAIAALNQELGTSFDPSKMGTPEVAANVLKRVRLQKNLAQRADSLEVVRGPDGTIDGRATLSQIIPMLEGMAKLEGLSGTEGTQKMMIGLLAPKLDVATMLAAGMIDPAGGLTGAGIQYLAGRVNDIPIEQVRKLARHMVDASPGMAGIYQTYQSKTPRAMPVAGLDSFSGYSAAPAKTDPLAAFLRPSGAKADQKTPRAPREAKGVTPAQFDRQWAAARPGDKVVGPDGKTYTKGGR